MKNFAIVIVFIFWWGISKSQETYFPPLLGDQWETISPASLKWNLNAIDELYDFLEETNSKVFILLKDGRIVFEMYFGSFTADSAWYWASAGKTLTSFMVGIAQQDGFLSIGDTVSKYLGSGWTSYPPEQEEKITIRHQLTMTTGLDDMVPNNHCTLPSCLQFRAEAGTRWAYHNAPYTLLDKVLANATGQTLNQYLTRKLLLPTGMSGLFVPLGYNNVFFSKPRSMARFGLLILNQGNWNGNQIMTDSEYFSAMINTSQQLNKSYGYLWWLNGKESFILPQSQLVFQGYLTPNAPAGMILAAGYNGQLLNIVPEQNLVWLRMGNSPDEDEISAILNDQIWEKLNRVTEPATGNLNMVIKDSEIKIYANPSNRTITVDLSEEIQVHPYTVDVYNLNGAKIHSIKHYARISTIDMGHYPGGIYVAKVIINNKTVVRKVWVQP